MGLRLSGAFSPIKAVGTPEEVLALGTLRGARRARPTRRPGVGDQVPGRKVLRDGAAATAAARDRRGGSAGKKSATKVAPPPPRPFRRLTCRRDADDVEEAATTGAWALAGQGRPHQHEDPLRRGGHAGRGAARRRGAAAMVEAGEDGGEEAAADGGVWAASVSYGADGEAASLTLLEKLADAPEEHEEWSDDEWSAWEAAQWAGWDAAAWEAEHGCYPGQFDEESDADEFAAAAAAKATPRPAGGRVNKHTRFFEHGYVEHSWAAGEIAVFNAQGDDLLSAPAPLGARGGRGVWRPRRAQRDQGRRRRRTHAGGGGGGRRVARPRPRVGDAARRVDGARPHPRLLGQGPRLVQEGRHERLRRRGGGL